MLAHHKLFLMMHNNFVQKKRQKTPQKNKSSNSISRCCYRQSCVLTITPPGQREYWEGRIKLYKIQDTLFPIHGPHKDIIGTNIQRKNHNYIEYSYTMTYLSQHIKSNKQVINNNHVVFVARLQSLIQIIFDKFAHCIKYWDIFRGVAAYAVMPCRGGSKISS